MQNEDGKSNAGSDVGSDVGSDDGSEEGSPVNKRRGRGRSVDDIIDDEDVIIVLKPSIHVSVSLRKRKFNAPTICLNDILVYH